MIARPDNPGERVMHVGPEVDRAGLVSIIVPSFNLAAFLPRTLDSILQQTYRPVEVIVVDGGSTDGTIEILKQYSAEYQEVRWISESDEGPADAVNKGLALAQGEICAIQSADDVYLQGAFDEVVTTFARHPEVGLIYSDCDAIDVDDRFIGKYTMPPFSWESFFAISMCLPQSSVFFRTSLARDAGGWNPVYFACDLDFWLRVLLRTRPLRIERPLSAWRLRPEQRTRPEHNEAIWAGYWSMIEDSEDLKVAPRRVRRLARASRHLLALQFHPTGNPWSVRWHALRALPSHPTFWRYHPAVRTKALVPGWQILRRAKSYVFSKLGPRKRDFEPASASDLHPSDIGSSR